jgi:predicted phosphodiesterase
MYKSQIAREYRDKYGAEIPTRRLAAIIHKQNPTIFSSLEDARATLRYIEGKRGGDERKFVANSRYFMKESRPTNPYHLPKSYSTERKTHQLPKSCSEILLMSDIHLPYHCTKSLTAVFDYGLDASNKINAIVLNGDVMDFHRISKHETDLRKRSVPQEFDAANKFLYTLRDKFPEIPIYWIKGNHDIRWEKYLQLYAPQIWDDNYFSLEERLGLKAKNITLIQDLTLVMAGNLLITHGHRLIGGGLNPAKRAFQKAGQPVIMSHLHRRDYYKKRNAVKTKTDEAWVTGCLCELSPDYHIISDSENGFAHISVSTNGAYTVRNYEINNGTIKI